jgi:adenylate cyclase
MLGPVSRAGAWRQAAVGLALALLVAFAYTLWRGDPLLQSMEGQALDWRFNLRGPLSPGPETVLVVIDDRTLSSLGPWPLSRHRLAEAVEVLAADGAAVIAFDLLFIGSGREEPDQPSPGTADRALTEAVSEAGAVVLPIAVTFDPEEANLYGLPQEIEESAYPVYLTSGGALPSLGPTPAGLLVPPPPLLAAGHPAHVNVFPDGDGDVRFAQTVIAYGDALIPSLPLEAFRLFSGLKRSEARVEIGEGIQMGPRSIVTDGRMQSAVNFYGPSGSFERHSLLDLIEGRVPRGTFTGRIVLIGTTALGVADSFSSPFGRSLPGIEFFATVVDNYLSGRALIAGLSAKGVDLLAIFLGAGLGTALWYLSSPGLAMLAAAVLLGSWAAINYAAFAGANLWLNFTFPAVAIILSVSYVAADRMIREHGWRRKAERKSANLTRYVSPLVSGGRGMPDGGDPLLKTQYAAIMFVDIAGFTKMSESMAPGETMALLRAFHRRVERAVEANNGVIDKFLGDGVLVIFGLPEPGQSDGLNAVACARDIASEVTAWQCDVKEQGRAPVKVGIGVHYGPVTIGEIGGERQSQVSVAGDTVNVASRLQALTRDQEVTIVASDAVIDAARAAGSELIEEFSQLPMQEIRGRDRPIGAWAWPSSVTRNDGATVAEEE